jgi:hypothetical protein
MKWFLKMLSNSTGEPSSRRVNSFMIIIALLVVIGFDIYIMFQLTKGVYPISGKIMDGNTLAVLDRIYDLIIVLCAFVLILSGIVTVDQVVSLVFRKPLNTPTNENQNTNTPAN